VRVRLGKGLGLGGREHATDARGGSRGGGGTGERQMVTQRRRLRAQRRSQRRLPRLPLLEATGLLGERTQLRQRDPADRRQHQRWRCSHRR
jgi:hypothetical protein